MAELRTHLMKVVFNKVHVCDIPISQSLKYISQKGGNSPAGVLIMLGICKVK